MKNLRLYIILLTTTYSLSACKKYVSIPDPSDQILSDQIFTSDTKATSAVTAIYGNTINGSPSFGNFLTSVYGGMSSDELNRFNPSVVFQEFINNQLSPTNTQVKNIWSSAYKMIYYANADLEGLDRSTEISADAKKGLTGECKFIRAFCHFYLVNLFGDVPIVKNTDYQTNATLSRSSVTDVYQFIISDLNDARTLLSDTYPSNEKVRPNKWAATALLARVYLYIQDWKKAEALSSELIASGIFTPLQPPQSVFLKNSKEAIWQLMPSGGVLQETRQMRPSGTTPQVFINNAFISSFEPGDLRRQKWVDSVTFQSIKYYYPGKYKNTSTAVTEYYTVLRIGEQFLIRAEARANQNNVADAINDLNTIRTRSGLPSLPSSLNQAQLFTAIEQERKVELFGEWAHRWLDLKRTSKATQVLAPIKVNWQPTDILYPIPQDEVLINSKLTQNPGY